MDIFGKLPVLQIPIELRCIVHLFCMVWHCLESFMSPILQPDSIPSKHHMVVFLKSFSGLTGKVGHPLLLTVDKVVAIGLVSSFSSNHELRIRLK